VLELVVTHEEHPEILDVKRTKPVAGRKKGWRPSHNWPLTRREIGGILVAIIGTILRGILASKGVADSHGNGNDHEEGRLGAEAAAAVLIALGMRWSTSPTSSASSSFRAFATRASSAASSLASA